MLRLRVVPVPASSLTSPPHRVITTTRAVIASPVLHRQLFHPGPRLAARSLSSTSLPTFTARRIANGLASRSRERVRAMSSEEGKTSPSGASSTFYEFKPLDNQGEPHPMSQHQGQVVLIVNVASKCGFTPQYTALETLFKRYEPTGKFAILGFPCNQFGGQEPGSNEDIQQFCRANYGVSFPVLGKIDVNGDRADPLWAWLKAERSGIMGLKMIKWNFEKFLVGPDGKVVERWASTTKPESLEKAIREQLLKAGVENLEGS